MSQSHSNNSTKMKLHQLSKKRPQKSGMPIIPHRTPTVTRIYDSEGLDVTPKPIIHKHYPVIEEKQELTRDTMGMRQESSILQLMFPTSGLRSTSTLFRSSIVQPSFPAFGEKMESLLSVSASIPETSGIDDLDDAPSLFCLSSTSTCRTRPEKISIVLRETQTFFLFDMPQLTVDLDTAEGQAVKDENDRYDSIIAGGQSNRKLTDVETQTTRIYTKSRSTYQERQKRMNQGTFVNNWVMYDTYNELSNKENGDVVERENSLNPHLNQSQDRWKLTKISGQHDVSISEDQIMKIYEKSSFKTAVATMERVIASKFHITAQMRFKGIIQQDPCSLDLKFLYRLDLLWIHTCPQVQGRGVSCICWNYTNINLLAVGYEASPKESDGILLIWCMKNPDRPDRVYKFDSPISTIDWSRVKPNQLAIGFYDGGISIIDVSSKDLVILRKTTRQSSPTFSPYWQVQWWHNDDNQEEIFASNQDGRIFSYQTNEDFIAREMMRIPRIEGNILGVKRMNCCTLYDIPISKYPGALLLRRHPVITNIYLIGSDEGCVYQCSTNYVHHHVDSYLAHDGPIYSLEFSPFCSKVLLTCGADWCTRIWADGITEPLITLSTRMACVRSAAWSPINSTIIANCVNNEICIWDINRRTYRPTSITISSGSERLVLIEFTKNGNQLVVADAAGAIYIYNSEDMPLPPFDQTSALAKAIEKSLLTKPELLKKLRKVGEPF